MQLVFKNTSINSKTQEMADRILEGEIYLHDKWESVKISEDITWNENPLNDNTWQLFYHSLRMVSVLVNAFEITEDKKYLLFGKKIIISWWKKNKSIKNKELNKYAWNDHSSANRTINLLYFWSRYKEINDYNFKILFIEILRTHGKFLEDEKNYSKYNHGIFQSKALLEISVVFERLDIGGKWRGKSIKRISDRFKDDISESGIHKEHSPDYHIIVLNHLIKICDFMDYYKIKSEELKEKIYEMQEYLAYILQKNNCVPILGDSVGGRGIGDIKKYIVNEHLRYKITNGVSGNPQNDKSRVFKDSGVAIFKEDNEELEIYFVMTAAFNSVIHKHSDDLSFVLNVKDTEYFVDSGMYNYHEKDKFRKYMRSVFAHNTIAVDGENYNLDRNKIGDSRIISHGKDSEKGCQWVVGKHDMYKDVSIERRIIHVENVGFLIHDIVASNNQHKYSQVFNIGRDVRIIKASKGGMYLESKIDDSKILLAQVDEIDDLEVYFACEDPVRGWQSFEHFEKHGISNIEFIKKGDRVEFRTLISFAKDNKIDSVNINEIEKEMEYKFKTEKDEEIKVRVKVE